MEQYRLIVSENYHRDIKNILHYISVSFTYNFYFCKMHFTTPIILTYSFSDAL